MSEPKKKSEILQEMINSQAKRIEKLETIQEKKSLTTSTEKHEHTDHSANVEFDCPECQQLYDKKIGDTAIKKYKEELKEFKEPVICEGCGEIVEKETEECPTCHGTNAKRIG